MCGISKMKTASSDALFRVSHWDMIADTYFLTRSTPTDGSPMNFEFSTLIWIFFILMMLQPIVMGRLLAIRRADAIRKIEKAHNTRVITMIHRQEKKSLFGFSVARHIDMEDAQTIIAAIKETPEDRPIDMVLHTPGGLVLAAMQIARAVEAHPAKVTVFVPVFAMSGGTLIALAADEIVLGEFSMLGPIDPQLVGLPAASIVAARDAKPVDKVFDLTLVLADVSEKALAQVKRHAVELMTPRMEKAKAKKLAEKLAGGHWTHDYALTAEEASEIGLPVKVGMPKQILDLMKLYSAPVQRSGVEYLPLDIPGTRQS
jgi:ClpP class serine protease